MHPHLFAGVVAITLLIPTYCMAAGTDVHEMEDRLPSPAAAAVASEVLPPSQPFWVRGPQRHYEPRRERR
jgi:hypothetical protein